MVFTIEPGLYFQPDDLTVPEEYRGIGVRIEDDILVTATARRTCRSAIPRTADDVEAWLRARCRRRPPRSRRAATRRRPSAEGTAATAQAGRHADRRFLFLGWGASCSSALAGPAPPGRFAVNSGSMITW